jgi:hypothetical protein
MSGFMLTEMILMTSPLMWVPGGDAAARVYYFLNGVLVMIASYLALVGDKEEAEEVEETLI